VNPARATSEAATTVAPREAPAPPRPRSASSRSACSRTPRAQVALRIAGAILVSGAIGMLLFARGFREID
jgi:hypothetical protein